MLLVSVNEAEDVCLGQAPFSSPLLVGALEAGVAALMSLCVFLEGALGPVAGTETAREEAAPGIPGSSSSLMELCCGDNEMDHSAAASSVTLDCLWGPVRAAVMLLLRILLLEGACAISVFRLRWMDWISEWAG